MIIKQYLDWEGLPYQCENTTKVLKLSNGQAHIGVATTNGEYIGGFYKLVKYIESKGLRRI